MPTYQIFFKAEGYWEGEVEADSRDEAVDIAYFVAQSHGEPDWELDWVEEL